MHLHEEITTNKEQPKILNLLKNLLGKSDSGLDEFRTKMNFEKVRLLMNLKGK